MKSQSVLQSTLQFEGCKPVICETSDALLTSDAGLLPIRGFDETLGFTQQFADALHDPRDARFTRHSFRQMTRSRIFGILADYEDQNDHDWLRDDPVFRIIAAGSLEVELASQPTHSRFENAIDIPSLRRLQEVLIDQFIDAFKEPPTRLTLRYHAVESNTDAQDLLDSGRFDFAGSISLDALKSVLSSNNFEFQLWGPSLMVDSLKQSLTDWGVPERRVRSEIFGAPLAPAVAAINGRDLPRPASHAVARTLTWKPAAPVAEETWPVDHGRVLKNPAYRSSSDDVTRRIQRRRAAAAIG